MNRLINIPGRIGPLSVCFESPLFTSSIAPIIRELVPNSAVFSKDAT